jgi:3-oxoacyl-(acyl-carrier-protein) synthase
MTISVYGIGWLTTEGYGCIRSGLMHSFESGEGAVSLPKKDIFSHPFKNFGRLDLISKMTAFGVSLALQDAGIEYSPVAKQNIGIVGTNAEGSLRSDIEYFQDYLMSGRTLSRGNLFIYTLPSSPIGEAAIHFGFLGPVLYAAGENNSLSVVLDLANEMIIADEAPVMLAGMTEADEAMFFVIGQERVGNGSDLCAVTEAQSLVETGSDVAGLVKKFIRVTARKA